MGVFPTIHDDNCIYNNVHNRNKITMIKECIIILLRTLNVSLITAILFIGLVVLTGYYG